MWYTLFRTILITSVLSLSTNSFSANPDNDKLKPFVLAYEVEMTLDQALTQIKNQLAGSEFEIITEYRPYDDAVVLIITSDALKKSLIKESYGGFAAPQRVSLTKVGKLIQIAYTNPVYMQHAYRFKVDLSPVLTAMEKALGKDRDFGGEGLSPSKLERYRYSFGLEDFTAFYEAPEFSSQQEAINQLEQGFSKPENGISKIYRIDIPGTDQVVFGIDMSHKTSGNKDLDLLEMMQTIDHKPLKRTAYLPYEILVKNNKIIALHPRFRIAVNFYDLKMFGKNGFGKLFSVPQSYENAFSQLTGQAENQSSNQQLVTVK